MKIDKLIALAKIGEEKPLILFDETNKVIIDEAIDAVRIITDGLPQEGETKSNLLELIELLQGKDFDELKIAKLLQFISRFVLKHKASEPKGKDFHQAVNGFYDRALVFDSMKSKREYLKQQKTESDQNEYDHRLFKTEGMMYVLEYYLTMYRLLVDFDNERQKIELLTKELVDIQLAKLSGLWHDFNKDEVLQKFVLLILNDESRENLLEEYYKAKSKINLIEKRCIDDKCVFNFDKFKIEKFMSNFKSLLLVLMSEFEKRQIFELTSTFLTPYGNKPKFRDIKL